MPKTNTRPRGPEADLASRIAMEREHRGMSAVDLARRMTERGCPIHASAINKIEQGVPPRRITVDELVALAQVFGLELEELLLPAHAARDHELEVAYREVAGAAQEALVLAHVIERMVRRLGELTPVGDAPSAALVSARTDFEGSLKRLTEAVGAVSEDIRERLRRQPVTISEGRGLDHKPRTGELKFGSSVYEKRAARAAAPPSRRRKPEGSK